MTAARIPAIWELSWRCDPSIARLADRHYSRLTPGSRGFVGSGRPLVLGTPDRKAAWCSFWQPHPTHSWKLAWTNSLFRNEGPYKASLLIRQATAITRYEWGDPPPDGFITFVKPGAVRPKKNPGHCYVIAGWRVVGETSSGLIVLQLLPDRFPEPLAPFSNQLSLPLPATTVVTP